jgi:hypothetical protein
MATPPPIVSNKYFCEVGDPECLKLTFVSAVMSVKITGEGACGPGGGGFFGISVTLYERPVRWVGVGDGCWAKPVLKDKKAAKIKALAKQVKRATKIFFAPELVS